MFNERITCRFPLKTKFFPDIDTLLIQFSEGIIAETCDLNENVLVETDQDGRVISMTVEHAGEQDVREFSYQWATA